ncbi:PO21 protein, partial [Pachycephala philippinensis]|nr:PO21 protein [Pachycephala philippinensis]
VVTARLTKACPINLRQRGFLRVAGCSENLKLLQLLIRNPKEELRELAIVFVDIVFDAVSHHHILRGLKQKEVDPHIIHLIKNMYKNNDTCIT